MAKAKKMKVRSYTRTVAPRASRPAQAMGLMVRDPQGLLPAPAPVTLAEHDGVLGDEASTGALGIVEVKLTDAEELVLSRAVNMDDVLMKPTGQPYLSHPAYTKWFNAAFGRLGWAIVPKSKPVKLGTSVVCHYLLYIHGQPVAFAIGEQEYHENNREQTYGDAVEATVASALRRCAKRLGVGLELWDKRWLQAFIDERCVKVFLRAKGGDDPKVAWRLKTDRPFWNESGAVDSETSRRDSRETAKLSPPAISHDGKGNEKITAEQVKRLWVIARKAGREDVAVKAWLVIAYGVDSSKDIKRKDYETICDVLGRPGPLLMPGTTIAATATREPGEEG